MIWMSLSGLCATGATLMIVRATLNSTTFFCISCRLWKRKSSSCACSTFMSSLSSLWDERMAFCIVLRTRRKMRTHALSFSLRRSSLSFCCLNSST
uniref:Putative secreted protein n=1 Tax=Ixodes ricinus TaxID=34613 RepID=A0A6B0UDB4_IXORI